VGEAKAGGDDPSGDTAATVVSVSNDVGEGDEVMDAAPEDDGDEVEAAAAEEE
jgi:hypothetical protein